MKQSWLLLALIIFLGLVLRFYRISDYNYFGSDQAIELSAVKGILSGHLTLIGIKTSNSEVRNGAVMYYFLAPFVYFLRGEPVAGGVLQTLLSVGTAVPVFLAGKILKSVKVGLIAALTISFSALLIDFSRQTLLAFYPLFFAALVTYTLVVLTRSYQQKVVFFLGVLLGFSLQVHYSSLSLVIAGIVFPLKFIEKRLWWKYFASLGLGFILGFLPMLTFELRHGFFNSRMFINLLLGHSTLQNSSFNFVSHVINSISQYFFAGNYSLSLAFIISLLVSVSVWRKSLPRPIFALFIIILSNLFFVGLFVKIGEPHYILPAVPALIILSIYSVFSLSRKLPNYSSIIFFTLFALMVVNIDQSEVLPRIRNYPKAGQIEDAARIIAVDSGKNLFNVTMLTGGESQGLPIRYFLGENQYLVPGDKYGQEHILYVLAPNNIDPLKVKMLEINAMGTTKESNSWPLGGQFQLVRLAKV